MGCDGGVIANSRVIIVTLKKKQKELDRDQKEDVSNVKFSTCALSDLPLREPIVACRLGFLYNKEAVIQHLIEKTMPFQFKHIRNLKELIEVKFSRNPDFIPNPDPSEKSRSRYICPVSLLEVNGQHKVQLIATCGHVFSEKALREVPSTTCLECQRPFTPDDVIVLNGSEDEVTELRKKMEERAATLKAQKQKKGETNSTDKSAKAETSSTEKASTGEATGTDKAAKSTNAEGSAENKSKGPTPGGASGASKRKSDQNGSVVSGDGGLEPPRKVALSGSSSSDSRKVARAAEAAATAAKNASSAYASIFLSNCKEKPKETFLCRNLSIGRK